MNPFNSCGYSYLSSKLTPGQQELFLKKCTNEDMKCDLCLQIIENPVSPQCLHSFCEACFKEIADQAKNCPTCRKPMVIIDGKAHAENNIYINCRMAQLWEKVIKKSKQLPTEPPKDDIKTDYPIYIKSQQENTLSPQIDDDPWDLDDLFQTIFEAIISGDFDHSLICEMLNSNRKVINQCNKNGATLLHIACQTGNVEFVKVLLPFNIDLNQINKKTGEFPLGIAAKAGRVKVLNFLLDNGANINQQDDKGNTALSLANLNGKNEIENILIAALNKLSQNTDSNVKRQDARSLAINSNKRETLHNKQIKNQNQIVNAPSNYDWKPEELLNLLQEFMIQNSISLLEEHLQNYPEIVNIPNENGYTLFHIACRGDLNLVEILFKYPVDLNQKNAITGDFPLKMAWEAEHLNVIHFLLNKGADINLQDCNGNTLLSLATEKKDTETIQLLMKYEKLLIDKENNDGDTPIIIATRKGYSQLEYLFRNNGASKYKKNQYGDSASTFDDRITIIESDYRLFNYRDMDDGNSPLIRACLGKDKQKVINLLSQGASINYPNSNEESPLYIAVKSQQLDMSELLLNRGAAINTRYHNQDTVLHIATRLNNINMVKLLLKQPAIWAQLPNKDGDTPLDLARNGNKTEIAELLIEYRQTQGYPKYY